MLLLTKAGLKAGDAELVRTGGFGEGVAALETGQIDVAPIAEPLWSQFQSKYRAVARASDILPPLDNVVGVTTVNMAQCLGLTVLPAFTGYIVDACGASDLAYRLVFGMLAAGLVLGSLAYFRAPDNAST